MQRELQSGSHRPVFLSDGTKEKIKETYEKVSKQSSMQITDPAHAATSCQDETLLIDGVGHAADATATLPVIGIFWPGAEPPAADLPRLLIGI